MRGSAYARYVLGVMVGINFLNAVDRYILPAVLSSIKADFHLSDFESGLLGTAFLLVYALTVVPFGLWADLGVRRTVIGVGVTIWSIATLFTGLARNYGQLFAARAVLGIGEASYFPAGTSLLADYFPKASRGRAMSIWNAGAALGIAVGFAGGGVIASRYGWRVAYYLTAVPGLVCAILAFRLREPLRGAAEPMGKALERVHDVTWARVVGLLGIPTLRASIIAETLLYFVIGGLGIWLPTFLQRRFGMGVAGAAVFAGGVLVVGALVGTLAGGWIGDRLNVRNPRGNLLVCIAGFAGGGVMVVLALTAPSLALFVPAFLLGAIFLYLYNGPMTALRQNIVLPSLRASAIMLGLFVAHLLGDAISPTVIGWLSDQLGSLRLALLIVSPTLLFIAALVAVTGLPTVAADTATMETEWKSRSLTRESPLPAGEG
jgi:MFS transporter, Spinster family, sphingosine-1-phosphate transporter